VNYFPINLNLHNRCCIVIGGGKVAERKVFNLLEFNVTIKIISKDFTQNLWNIKNKFNLINDTYDKKYLENSALVFICTNNKNLNEQIYSDAKNLNCLVNIVTHPELCDFTIPSLVKRGSLKIAISTDGKSPAISKLVKHKINECINKEYGELVELMGKIREKQLTINRTSDINRELFYKFINSDILKDLKNKDQKAINEKIKNIFGFTI
jgi:precorrin-2 dehydrogenase/sirohydrochlorin ferrochelatase